MSIFAGVKQEIDVRASIKDQSGRDIKIDLRADEDSQVKLEAITRLLLGAGYFRARISTLPPFDKIVGGLVWCITVCNVDLDVDLLYQENSTIGQKITLTEKIVAVLPRMKCPHELQPHQIQGLDCVKIFPVVQWLVKKAMDRREEMAQTIRSFAEMQFGKDYALPSEREEAARAEAALPNVERFIRTSRPGRLYRRPRNVRKLDIKLQAQSTLLEYGALSSVLEQFALSTEETEEKGGAATAAGDAGAEQEERRMEELLRNVKANPLAGPASSSISVGQLLQERSSELAEVTTQYEEEQATLNEGATRRAMLVTSHERTVRGLNSQVSQLQGRLSEHAATMAAMKERYVEVSEQLTGLTEKIELGTTKIRELEQQSEENLRITDAEKEQVAALVKDFDAASRAKDAFTAECKERAKEYKESIGELQTRLQSLEEDKRSQQVQEQHTKDKAKLAKVRLQAAKKNYAISALRRQVEAIPSRIELIQYQKRFEELHVQTGQVHTEAKQFYSLFNNLSDTKTYLEKHLVRLNSINDGFARSMQDLETGYIFLAQFERIVEGARTSREGIEVKREEAKRHRDGINDEYLVLVDLGRRYAGVVRKFQEECDRTELLVKQARELGIEA